MRYVHVNFILEVPDGVDPDVAVDKSIGALVDAAENGGWCAVGATHPMGVVNEGSDDECLTCSCDSDKIGYESTAQTEVKSTTTNVTI